MIEKLRKIGIIVVLAIVFYSFFSIMDFDMRIWKEGVFILPNEKIGKERFFVNGKEITIYRYRDYVMLKELDIPINKDEFQHILESFKKILICEFSDFGYRFARYSKSLDKDLLYRVVIIHSIKKREMDKYDVKTIVTRFIRAFKERRLSIFYIPDHAKRREVIDDLKKKLRLRNNLPKRIMPDGKVKIFASIGVFIFVMLIEPYLTVPYVLMNNIESIRPWLYSFLASFLVILLWGRIVVKENVIERRIFKGFFIYIVLGILLYSYNFDYIYIYKLQFLRGTKILLLSLPLLIFLASLSKIRIRLSKKDIVKVGVLFGIIVFYYILRSGNFSLVINWERKFRDFLDNTLFVRPRFKELISYASYYINTSITILIPLIETLKSIYAVSILDTFMHIHSPMYLGIIRSLYSLLFVEGFVFIYRRFSQKLRHED